MAKKKFNKKKAIMIVNKVWLAATICLVAVYTLAIVVFFVSKYKDNRLELVKNSVQEYNKIKFGYTGEDVFASAFESNPFYSTIEFNEISNALAENAEKVTSYDYCGKVYFKIVDYKGDISELDKTLGLDYVAGWDVEYKETNTYYYGTPNVSTSTFDDFPNRVEYSSTTLDECIQHLTQIIYSDKDTLLIDENYGTYLVSSKVSDAFSDTKGEALSHDEFYLKCAEIFDAGYPSNRLYDYLNSYHNIKENY